MAGHTEVAPRLAAIGVVRYRPVQLHIEHATRKVKASDWLPAPPLIAMARIIAAEQADMNEDTRGGIFVATVDTHVAALLGIDIRQVMRWKQPGARIHWVRADELAAVLQLHPSDLWPEEWWLLV